MKKWATLAIIIIFSFISIIVGCEKRQSTKEEVYENFHKKIVNTSSYKCVAEVEVRGNKTPGNYTFIQQYEKPSNYKLEITSPEQMSGKIIEYNKDNILIKNPNIDDLVTLPNTYPNNQYLFIGDFISNYINNEEVEIGMNDEYLMIKTGIPGESDYFAREILYVDKKTKTPTILEIIDKSDNVRFKVVYKDFEFKK